MSTTRSYKDANWILYRMADVLLMKAEALIWKGGEANFAQALELINKIRTRANVTTLSVQTNAVMHKIIKQNLTIFFIVYINLQLHHNKDSVLNSGYCRSHPD